MRRLILKPYGQPQDSDTGVEAGGKKTMTLISVYVSILDMTKVTEIIFCDN